MSKSMEFNFLGGAGEIGRSAILVNEDLLLDYGIKSTTPATFPQGALRPKSVIISHGHLDHCGLIPNLMDLKPKIICTPMTAKLTALLARDSLKIANNKKEIIPYEKEEIVDFEHKVTTINYNQIFKTGNYTGCLYDAGHIPGSSMVRIDNGKKSLFYTGDLNTTDTELQNGAHTDFPENDILMIESTYFNRNHTPRKQLEKRFIDSVNATRDIGGNVIIAAFSIGRTQELMMILRKHHIPISIDGMGREVCKFIQKRPESVGNYNRFNAAYCGSNMITSKSRDSILDEPAIIVTSAGMLNGGPVLHYMECIKNDPKSKLMLTGYQVEGTVGRSIIDRKPIRNMPKFKCAIEHFDFSAHIDGDQLKKVTKSFCDRGTETVIVLHGSETKTFAEWIKNNIGTNAIAPKIGEKVII